MILSYANASTNHSLVSLLVGARLNPDSCTVLRLLGRSGASKLIRPKEKARALSGERSKGTSGWLIFDFIDTLRPTFGDEGSATAEASPLADLW